MLAFLVINACSSILNCCPCCNLQCCGFLSLPFNNAKSPPKWILREFNVSRIRSRLGGLPHREAFTWQKIWPRLKGLPGLADRATRLGGSPYWLCKRNQIKTRDYMDRRVTPPTWGPPSPCKQVLKVSIKCTSSALESPSVNWPIKPTSV